MPPACPRSRPSLLHKTMSAAMEYGSAVATASRNACTNILLPASEQGELKGVSVEPDKKAAYLQFGSRQP